MSDAPPPKPPLPIDRTLRRVLTYFALISAVLVAVVVVAMRDLSRSELSADWVNHTHAVILEIDGVLSSTNAGDGALRTFVMTGETGDLTAGRDAFAAMSEHLEVAKALTRDEIAQHVQILHLETLVNQRAELAQRVFVAWQKDRTDAVRLLVAGDAASATIGEIRRAVESLKAEEMALLAERDTASYYQAQHTRWIVWMGVTLDGLLLGGVAWLIRDDLRARRRAAAVLEEANLQLEFKVRERTLELSTANAKLVAENLEQRWAHQAAEHQLRYYQNIFNSLNDLVFVVTKALSVSRVNPAVVDLTGSEPSALIDRPLANLVRLAGDTSGKLDSLARALREGREVRGQLASIPDARGQPASMRLALFPVRDRDKVVGGVVVLDRITPESPAS